MTSEPVSGLPDPKYAVTTDSDGISGLEPMTEAEKAHFRAAPCYLCGYNGAGYYQPDTHACAARYHATDEDFIKALKSERDAAIAQLDEARADAAHEKKVALLACEDALGFKTRAEAAEARLEELTREPAPFPQERIEGEELLASFVQSFRSGAQGAMMDCDAAEAVAIAIEAMLARLEDAKAVLGAMLAHSCVADSAAEDKDAEDHDAERAARAFLHQGGSDAR